MNELYLGARNTKEELISLLNRSDVQRVNRNIAKVLREATVKIGFPRLVKSRKIEFFEVKGVDYERLIDDGRTMMAALNLISFEPLVSVPKVKIDEIMIATNARYPNALNSQTAVQYTNDLIEQYYEALSLVPDDEYHCPDLFGDD